jgi:hypothetical protein
MAAKFKDPLNKCRCRVAAILSLARRFNAGKYAIEATRRVATTENMTQIVTTRRNNPTPLFLPALKRRAKVMSTLRVEELIQTFLKYG